MNHSQSLPSIKSIYQLTVGQQNNWGLESYTVAKKYEDPIKAIQQREYKAKKNQKKVYITKKGHYLDDIAKLNKSPGPGTYTLIKQWVNQKENKKSYASEKKTYIDNVFAYEKKNKYPAPGTYEVLETEDQLKNKLKKWKERKIVLSDKLNFIDTCEFNSLMTPGPGNYNPHQIKIKLRENHFNPEQIRKIDAEKEKNKKLDASPDMNSYDPIPVKFQSFQRRQLFPKHYEQRKNGWGTQARLNNTVKPNKQNGKPELPGPGHYNTIAHWQGKINENNTKNCLKLVSSGIHKSVYY